jgi:hypothetical protein
VAPKGKAAAQAARQAAKDAEEESDEDESDKDEDEDESDEESSEQEGGEESKPAPKAAVAPAVVSTGPAGALAGAPAVAAAAPWRLQIAAAGAAAAQQPYHPSATQAQLIHARASRLLARIHPLTRIVGYAHHTTGRVHASNSRPPSTCVRCCILDHATGPSAWSTCCIQCGVAVCLLQHVGLRLDPPW